MPAMTWTPSSIELAKRWSFHDKKMPSGVSFSRNSTSYYLNRNGIWTSLAAHEPGFWYAYGSPSRYRGYIPFGERKNLLPSGADDLSGASWDRPAGISVTANSMTGAMDTQTMWEVNDTATNSNKLSLSGVDITGLGTKPRLLRAELKAGTASTVRARMTYTGGTQNTEQGTFTLSGSGSRTAETNSEYVKIKPLGNSTYLCSVALRNTGGNTSAAIEFSAGSADSNTGTFGIENVAIENATEDAGCTIPGPPIAPQVTRLADRATASYTMSSAAAIIVQADMEDPAAGLSYAVCFNNSSGTFDLVNIQTLDDPLQDSVAYHAMAALADVGGPGTAGLASAAFPRVAFGVRAAANDYSCDGKSITGTTDTSGAFPSGMNEVAFGFLDLLDNGWFCQGLLRVDVYTTALTRANVQRILWT